MVAVWNKATFTEPVQLLGGLRVHPVASTTTAAYVTLVVLLRVSGKRTLAKLNAFDLVVTVALGSTLATILLSNDVELVEGVLALGVLVGAQYEVAWTSVRSAVFRKVVKSTPAMLVLDGEIFSERLRSSRMSEGEIRQAVRASGYGTLSAVAAVVLETDGTLSVVSAANLGDGSALLDVPYLQSPV